ncbi:MAG TPA: CoA transferase [Vicinamibacterales bacterium]|nr:CoA transferase [Vicinamibacterales bacterium]
MSTSPSRALEGLLVLDVSQVMAGPFCAMQLADLGAAVIKIEPPGGDPTRLLPGGSGTESPGFNALNRGKRGIVLNLKSPPAREVFRRLARRADILVENYRPGVMAGFGLDYGRLSVDNPRLIYASASGYGQTGPDRRKGGFDLVAQGVSGLMSVTGEPGGAPVKCGVPVTDLAAGLFLLAGILAALYDRTRSGIGQCVDTSLVEAGLAFSVWEATEYFAGGGIPEPTGSAHRIGAPYQAFRCADGYVTIGAWNDRLFVRFSELLGHPEWSGQPEFASSAARVANRATLAAMIESITAAQPARHWLDLLDAHDIPCGPINNYEQALHDPQILARGMVQQVDHPTLGRLQTLGSPLKLSRTPPDPCCRAPLLGEHTSQVLAETGYSQADIEALRREGALG